MNEHMMPALASVEAQLELLETTGQQFTDEERRLGRRALPGVYVGQDMEPALYEARVVPEVPRVIVPSAVAYQGLCAVRPRRETLQRGQECIDNVLQTPGLIVGFCGYGSAHPGYDKERRSIEHVLDGCAEADLPVDYVVDGGTGYGVPGLAALLARKRGVSTLGFLPLRGLRSAAPHDTLVVSGEEFADAAPALGAMPDVLVNLGGGPITEEEMKAALRMGTAVLTLSPGRYPKESAAHLYRCSPLAKAAYQVGWLKTCETADDITDVVSGLDLEALQENRTVRRARLRTVLTPHA